MNFCSTYLELGRLSRSTMRSPSFVLLFAVCAVWGGGVSSRGGGGAMAYDDETLFSSVPMIMAHDAASGYLGGGLINAWTKTQSAGMREQLDCGARVFDARPELDEDKGLVWHHGDVTVDYEFSQSVEDIMSWTAAHPTELVYMDIWDCVGEGCMDAATTALTSAGVPIMDSCADLDGLTLGGLKAMAQTAGSGLLIASTADCANSNYDSTLACSGYQGRGAEEKDDEAAATLRGGVERCYEAAGRVSATATASSLSSTQLGVLVECAEALRASINATTLESAGFYNCYDGSDTVEYPLGRMMAYLDGVSSAGPAADGAPAQHQALWEETVASVVLGTLARSSLVKDENWSKLNSLVTAAVQEGRWKHINWLEVNDVCDGGEGLLAALKAM